MRSLGDRAKRPEWEQAAVEIDLSGAEKRVLKLDEPSRYPPRQLGYRVAAEYTAHPYALVNRLWRDRKPGSRSWG